MTAARTAAMPGRPVVFRLVSLLLSYPDEDLLASRDELIAAVHGLPDSPRRAHLTRFMSWFAHAAPMELACHYVETFDLRRRASLYLTYYLHGDTRRRGMALLLLKQRMRAAGLVPPEGELPDFLPVVCEFAAVAGRAGEAPLRQHRQGVELIRAAVHEAGSHYAAVLDALVCELPSLSRSERDEVVALASRGPAGEEVGLEPFAPPGYVTGTEVEL